ncbi:MAG TPA: type II toxin-antitoxin system VapC family toxin [Candidatus Limnocylindrales bacterium]|nr:type II toxin-antitoxin system VapC family toxin [Candidatus Limnocylindrales bacterium]
MIERSPVVVDASVIVDVLAGRDDAQRAWLAWARTGTWLLAPPLLPFEVANALVRGHAVPAALAGEQVRTMLEAGVDLADRGVDGLAIAIELAERHRLAVYDAAYLWLAIDTDAELATFDRALAAAATAEGVPLAIALD